MSKFILIALVLGLMCIIGVVVLPLVAGLVLRKLGMSILRKLFISFSQLDDSDNVIDGEYRVIDGADKKDMIDDGKGGMP